MTSDKKTAYAVNLSATSFAIASAAADSVGVSTEAMVEKAVVTALLPIVVSDAVAASPKPAKAKEKPKPKPKRKRHFSKTWWCPSCHGMFAPQGRLMHFVCCAKKQHDFTLVETAVQILDQPMLLRSCSVTPRKGYDEEAVEEIVASIRRICGMMHGVIAIDPAVSSQFAPTSRLGRSVSKTIAERAEASRKEDKYPTYPVTQ